MSPARTLTRERRARARRRELKREMARLAAELARLALAELDAPTPRADRDVVIEARIIGDEIITD